MLLSRNLSAVLFYSRNSPVKRFDFNFLLSISTLFALIFTFLHRLGSIDVLSTNVHTDVFSCLLIDGLMFNMGRYFVPLLAGHVQDSRLRFLSKTSIPSSVNLFLTALKTDLLTIQSLM